MPPFSLGLAQVEQRLAVVRRRLNLLTVQHAVYMSGSLLALAAALLVAVALRGRATLFALAVWTAVGAAAAAMAAGALRIRERWLSPQAVVRYADRRAALDDRLATLLSDPSRVRDSRLKEVLLEQILAAAPRWDVDTLAPRRVPRSLYALLGALAVLAVTSFLVRPPSLPVPGSAQRPHPTGADEPNRVAVSPGNPEHTNETSSSAGAGATMQLAGLSSAGGGVAPQHAPGPDASGREGVHAVPAAAAGSQPAAHPGGAPAADGAPGGADSSPRAMTEKLQDAIRGALGAETTERHAEERARSGAADQHRTADPSSTGEGTSAARNAAARTADGETRAAQPPNGSGALPGGGSAASPGARAGEANKELFGTQVGARLVGKESPHLAIKLGTFGAMAPNEVEPQRRAAPVSDVAAARAGHDDPAAPAEEQIPDAPLQKTDVAPEHEALVRRIFTRDE